VLRGRSQSKAIQLSRALPKYQAKRALKPTEARNSLPFDKLRARPSHNLDDF